MAASSEHAHDLECYQVQCREGPCLDCYHTGTAVLVPDLAAQAPRWPRFAPVAVQAGFASVHAVPTVLRRYARDHNQKLSDLARASGVLMAAPDRP